MPWVLAHADEGVTADLVFTKSRAMGRDRLSYRRPRRSDWIVDGTLLRARVRQSYKGKPLWRKMNTRRQFLAMERDLCQVCSLPATDPDNGLIPWIVTPTTYQPIGGGLKGTNAPPTCVRCMPVAREQCPKVREASEVFWVRHAEPVGVLGDVFEPNWRGYPVRQAKNVFVSFEEYSRHPMTLAHQLVVRLDDKRPFDRCPAS
ncbi:hypothetical protein ACIBCT_35130 [Streptosporangium sp. NPDC050855]|uniref:hypothetical protein n=1 Tax=Streptosporangium sp. NPDC050855 TaxID=3366194 RepID=UPI00378AFB0F